jgi:uncharacterized protein YcgI (DUF1989 family)
MMPLAPPACLVASGEISPGRATAIALMPGERLRIVNHLGQQVLDTWAHVDGDLTEVLSMEHCRDKLYKLFFEVGDVLISNRRRPLFEITADTSPGRHDTLCAACDARSYAALGLGDDHPNCSANYRRLLGEAVAVPCPWNLFMDIPVAPDGRLSDRPSAARPGDYVELRALTDLVVVCSPCPQELIPISGVGRPVRGVLWQRLHTGGEGSPVLHPTSDCKEVGA